MDWCFLQIGDAATANVSSETFAQKVAIAAVGPAISVVLGSLIVGLFVTWLTDWLRRRRTLDDMRERFIVKMSMIASTFYIESSHFLRAKAEGDLVQANEAKLNESYRAFRVAADALEERLRVCFGDDGPRQHWHAASDLLAIRYHAAIDRLSKEIADSNAGADHSTLDAPALLDPVKVRTTYKEQLKLAMRTTADARFLSG